MNDTGSRTSQNGQTLVLITVFMMSLLGMCALAIDVGSWYQQKRAVQNAADAGALAGAATLPSGWSAAASAAAVELGNNISGATVTYQPTSVYVTNDSIRVTASKPAQSFFAKALTSKKVTTSATATATFMNSGGGALPWGVIKASYTPGNTYPIFVDQSGPNFGSIRLPAWDTASQTCTTGGVTGGGANLYASEVSGSVTVCPVKIDDVIATKTGGNSGPTTQAVSDRCGGAALQPASAIASFPATGTPSLLKPASCQVVLLPVVVDASNGNAAWPTTGSGNVRVVGFSWWVVTAVKNQGKEVDAVYVGDAPITATSSGSTLPGAYTAQLTS
ncbi:MAG TPA: pilus assembly protein TadG-related protein [Gaiellales bacterium]|jgi:Flp pilus assembly protein TadG|nr:pilus assembly protein TadG-related protein [Gaiellales bacterium]